MLEFLKSRIFLAIIIATLVLIGLLQLVDETDQHPCAAKQYPGRCYRITREVCETSWNKFKDDCTAKVKALPLPPSRLTGPIEFNCQVAKLDRFFNYLRITNTDCDEQQEKLEKWKKTNPDF